MRFNGHAGEVDELVRTLADLRNVVSVSLATETDD